MSLRLQVTQNHGADGQLALFDFLEAHEIGLEDGIEGEMVHYVVCGKRSHRDVEVDGIDSGSEDAALDSAIENFLQALDEWRIHVLNFLRTPNMFGPMKIFARQKAIEFRDRYPDVGG